MRLARSVLFAGLGCLLIPVAVARAETKVELKGVHLCCPACAAAVRSTLKGVEGVKVACDMQKKVVTITAVDDSAAQRRWTRWPPTAFMETPAAARWRSRTTAGSRPAK